MVYAKNLSRLITIPFACILILITGCSDSHQHQEILPGVKLSAIQLAPAAKKNTSGFTDNTLAIGNHQQLEAKGIFADETTSDISARLDWESSDPSIVKVSNSGMAEAVAKGEAEVKATAKDGLTSNTIDISVTGATLVNIEVTPSKISVPVGLTKQMTATGIYSDGSTADITNEVTWKSGNISLAGISNSGELTAFRSGDINISATLGEISNSNTSNIKISSALLKSIQVSAEKRAIPAGYQLQLNATGIYTDDSHEDLTEQADWFSTDINTASISLTGRLRAKNIGNTQISAAFNGVKSNTENLEVTDALLSDIQITSSAEHLAKGESVQLIATGLYSDQTTQDLTENINWISDDASVAVVSKSGLLTAGNEGTTTITSNINGIKSQTPFTIEVSAAKIVTIQVTPAASSLAAGNGRQLIATGYFSDGTQNDITNEAAWTLNTDNESLPNNNVIDVSGTGYVTAVNPGQAEVSASLDGICNSDNVTLKVTPAELKSIQITPDIQQLANGVNQKLIAAGIYSDGTTADLTNMVTWETTNPEVALITQSGEVQAQGEGKVTVSADYRGVKSGDPQIITVTSAELQEITVTPVEASVAEGVAKKLTAAGRFTDGGTADISEQVSWVSSDTSVASVTQGGIVKGLSEGSSLITANLNGITSSGITSQVTEAQLLDIEILAESTQIPLGSMTQLLAVGEYSNGSELDITGDVTWTSDAVSTAAVTPSGQIEGIKTGTANIRASLNGMNSSHPVHIQITDAALTAIQVTPEKISLAAGTTHKLTATGYYSDDTVKDLSSQVNWISSDLSKATVTNEGSVTGLSSGNVVIHASFKGKKAADAVSLKVTSPKLTDIVVTPADIKLAAGLSQQLSATAIFSDETTEDITNLVSWTSTEPKTVSVTPAGSASGINIGHAEIRASWRGEFNSDVVSFDVTSAQLTSIDLQSADSESLNSIDMDSGGTQQLKAVGKYTDDNQVDLTDQVNWLSGDFGVATITSDGVVEGVSQGKTQITANLDGIKAQVFNIIIREQQHDPIRIIPGKGAETVINGRKDMYAQTVDKNGKKLRKINQQADWMSDDPTIATVNLKGEITGVNEGTTTIRVTYEDKKAQAPVTIINPKLEAITIRITENKGRKLKLKASGLYDNGRNYNINDSVSWISSDTSKATVNKFGDVKFRRVGIVTIKAAMEKVEGTIDLRIK